MSKCDAQSHIVDSRFYSSGYTTPEARRIFCDKYRYQRWLDVEVALAESQAELGIIPAWAADDIKQHAHIKNLDLEAIKEGLKETSHSLMPLLAALRNVCDEKAGQFIHYGATTQDIQDSAQILEIRDIIEIIERDFLAVIGPIIELATKYQNFVTIGRTHCQHALAMTLGLKIAVWLDEIWRNFERLNSIKDRLLVSQLFGGVGTMDAFGEKGFELLYLFSNKLGLNPPNTAWHAARDRIAEFLSILSLISGTFAKVADEIRCLARNEIGELEEPFQKGKVGSSTMPHKRNPEMCEQVVVLAKLINANARLGVEGLINEHERDYRSVRLEWVSITDASLFMCGQLAMMKDIVANLIVHEDTIQKNVQDAATFISTEAMMFYFGKVIGKQTAHQLIYEVSMEAIETGQPLIELLMKHPEVAGNFNQTEIEQIINPENHTGMSAELTRRTIQYVNEQKQKYSIATHAVRDCPLGSTCP